MHRIAEDLVDLPFFHQFARIHDADAVCDLRHDAEVVGDEQHGSVLLVAHVLHDVEDLRLHRYVQGGGRFIRDQELGMARQHHGDHHPLAHAAGQLVGEGFDAFLRIGDLHVPVELDDPFTGLLPGHAVQPEGFRHLRSGAVYGIEGIQGVLEDHADVLAPDPFHFALREPGEVLIFEEDAAAYLFVVVDGQAHDGMGHGGFAAAGLAHQRQDLAPFDGERHVVYGGQPARLDLIVYA